MLLNARQPKPWHHHSSSNGLQYWTFTFILTSVQLYMNSWSMYFFFPILYLKVTRLTGNIWELFHTQSYLSPLAYRHHRVNMKQHYFWSPYSTIGKNAQNTNCCAHPCSEKNWRCRAGLSAQQNWIPVLTQLVTKYAVWKLSGTQCFSYNVRCTVWRDCLYSQLRKALYNTSNKQYFQKVLLNLIRGKETNHQNIIY